MTHWPWRRITPATRTQQLLEEARMAELEHREAGEHHLALAAMYAARVARLEGAPDALPHLR